MHQLEINSKPHSQAHHTSRLLSFTCKILNENLNSEILEEFRIK